MQNPLFPTPDTPTSAQPSSGAPFQGGSKRIEPIKDPAVELIRQKIQTLYAEEPNAKQEIAEIAAIGKPRSEHQIFMESLSRSGRSYAEIQAAWHEYYMGLPDDEKHAVWQEFYAASKTIQTAHAQPALQPHTAHLQTRQKDVPAYPKKRRQLTPRTRKAADAISKASTAVKGKIDNTPSVSEIKTHILHTVSAGGTIKKKHHLKSLAFGLASGLVVVFIFLFSFFNEVVIAPFIQPSRQASATPVIVDPASTVVGGAPKILIPKINVEIPVDYSQTTIDEKSIELALDNGVVHYPTTVRPGQAGNAAFFGHSSNNIFNPGKYKFAFVLLQKMEIGDLFYLSHEGTTYAYRVYEKTVVQPQQVGVLGPREGKVSTATLITCDPPGTSINRLVVVGEQISPDPSGNTQPTTQPILTASTQSDLPGNGPTLWSRLWGSVF